MFEHIQESRHPTMPKDTKKNRYFQIGIGWESWTLEHLEADAKLHQMDDQPAKLIVLRLTEYYKLMENYKLVEQGVIVSGVSAMMAQVQQTGAAGHNGNGSTPAPKQKNTGAPSSPSALQQKKATNSVAASESAADNADAAMDFFLNDDDQEEQ